MQHAGEIEWSRAVVDGSRTPLDAQVMIGYVPFRQVMDVITQEIRSQPECWRRAAVLARGLKDVVPRTGRVAFVGCGTSLFIAQAAAAVYEAYGHGEADAFAAMEAPLMRPYDAVIAISRSGTTTEILRALREVRPGTPTIAVVGVPDSLIAHAVEYSFALDFADERSIVQTRFATSALAFFRAAAGEDVHAVAAAAEVAVSLDLPVDSSAYEHFVFLGSGWCLGLANEAALKLREAAQAWSESYPCWEYRHGPISVAGPHSLVWSLNCSPTGLAQEVSATGATFLELDLEPMAQLVVAQRLAVDIALLRGLDPERPRHLTRSVVLD